MLDALSKRMKEHETYSSSAATMEQTLKQELSKLAGERQRLATRERNIIEVEKSLSTALEAGGFDWEPTTEAKEGAAPPPAKERPPAPEPPKTTAPPPPPVKKESYDREFEKAVAAATRVSKADAIDKMNRALEAAKQARDAGQDVTEVRKILKQARTAFEAQDWDEAAKLSDDILTRLSATTTVH